VPPLPAAPLPESPEDIPEGASLSQLDRWIQEAELAIAAAKSAGNVPLIGSTLRVAAQLAEIRRKGTPPPPPNPNENPDMIAAAKRAREALHRLIDSATEKTR
jgi:hypothetical protein